MNKLPTLATSAWCEPCKQLKVQLEDMGIQVELADMTNDTDYFILHKIRSVPTLVTVDEEKIVGVEAIMNHLKK